MTAHLTCRGCGDHFVPAGPRQLFCTEPCQKRSWYRRNRKNDPVWREKNRARAFQWREKNQAFIAVYNAVRRPSLAPTPDHREGL